MTFSDNMRRAAYTHAHPGFHAASPPSPGLVPPSLFSHTKSVNDTGYNP